MIKLKILLSVGRLPGVSVTRVGGEGTKVVIRGVAPKYNVITIDGIRLASSEAGDRSTDLSMISSSMLEGIEVFKTVTADKDADALGGTVNFKLRKAKKGFKLSLQYENRNAEFAGSRDKDYFSRNILGNTILNTAELMGLDKDSEYKIIPSIEARLFKNRLGIFMQTSIDRKNLTSHEFAANYDNKTNDDSTYITQSIGLSHLPRDKERKNRAMIIDYKLSDGSISFANFSNSSAMPVLLACPFTVTLWYLTILPSMSLNEPIHIKMKSTRTQIPKPPKVNIIATPVPNFPT